MATHFEPPLGSTFRAYLQATDHVVQWIASTARATGSVTNLFEGTPMAAQRLAKLRPRETARPTLVEKLKAKKRHPTKSTKPTVDAHPSAFEISYPMLTKLGRAIANTHKVQVDYNVLCVRNQEKGTVNEAAKNNNKWRRRIIRVLEDLLKDLQSRPPSPSQSDVIDGLARSTRADSLVDGLDHVEMAESLYYTREIRIPKKEDDALYRLKGCLEDTAFAVYCYVQDATYLRLFSARAWREFALGSIGVQTATFCTNSAHAMLGKLSEQLRQMCPHLNDDSRSTLKHSKIDGFMRQNIANDMVGTDICPDTIEPDVETVGLARYTARRLGFYASTLLCSRMSIMLYEVFNTKLYLHPADTLEQTRLLKSLAQLQCLEWSKSTVEPLKTDCMYEAAWSIVPGHLDAAAVFAAQMLYEIHQQVDPQRWPLEEIAEAISVSYLELYDKYNAVWKHERIGGTRSARAMRMHDQYKYLRSIVNSNGDFQDDLDRLEKFTPRHHTIPRFGLLRHVPTLVGQLVAHHHEEYNVLMDIANDRGHILAAIHLYNAAKKSEALPPNKRWADMEWVIDSQDELYFFGGTPADTNSRYLKDYCDAYGLDLRKFSIGREPAKVEQVNNDIHIKGCYPRRLEACSKYIRACSNLKGLHKSNPGEWRLRMIQEFAEYNLETFSSHGSPHSIGLLIAAKEVYEGDEEALNFDVFAFHLTCAKLLFNIRTLCFRDAPNDYPSIRYNGGEGLNTIVAELLRDLQDCPRHHDRMWPRAVELLRDVIEQEGSACSDLASERMNMATLDWLNFDDRSDTMSLGSAASTPPLSDMEVDDAKGDTEVAEVSTRVREGDEESHAPSKRRKVYSSQPPSPSGSHDSMDSQQVFDSDYSIRLATEMLDYISQILSGQATVAETLPLSQNHENKLIYLQSVLQKCLDREMTVRMEDDGSLAFYQDKRATIHVKMPHWQITHLVSDSKDMELD